MNDDTAFEHRLTTALAAYADRAPVEIDPVTLTSLVANESRGHRWRLVGGSRADRRLGVPVVLLVLLGLATVLAAGLLVAGAFRSAPRPIVMTVGRIQHTATALADGRILVIGGFTKPSISLASAELYDPGTRTFTATGSMGIARAFHTATRLSDGRVLVIGGFENLPGVAPLTSAEIYDPKTGTFNPTGSMTTARWDFSATLLGDGRVLVAGGNAEQGELASAELYDPRTGTFTPTGPMVTAREGHATALLTDGRVLVSGGHDETASLASAEIYDPATAAFTPTAAMPERRAALTAVVLVDGRVLIVGGIDTSAGDARSLASAVLYDAGTGTFSPVGSMATGREGHAATLLPDGRVLVTGGTSEGNQFGGTNIVASAELFDPNLGTFSPTGSMTIGRAIHTATLGGDGRVLIAGGLGVIGESGFGPAFSSAETYDPAAGSFSSVQR